MQGATLMTTESNERNEYVKKETMIIVVLVALFLGFIGGIVFAIYKMGPETVQRPASTMSGGMPDGMPGGAPGLMPEAAKQMVSALEQQTLNDPENAHAWTELGNIYYDTLQYKKAISAYEKAIKIKPDNSHVFTDLGVMYRRTKQPVKAIENFEKALKIDPGLEQAMYNIGVVYMHDMNEKGKAIDVWEELVKKFPNAM